MRGGDLVKKYLIGAIICLLLFFTIFHVSSLITKNDNLTIFLIDSKIDKSFLSSPLQKIDLDSSHGSKTAALIRSITETKIIPLSAENFLGRITKENYLNALKEIKEYKNENPDKKILVNISLGFTEGDFQEEIIKEISDDKLLITAAAGNNNLEKGTYPAYFDEVLAAAALENNKKMTESNYGEFIDIAAPGIIEVNQYFNLPYSSFSRTIKSRGTSFAAPQVTAVIAQILSYNQDLTIQEAVKILKNTASPFDDQLYKEAKLGAGKLNLTRALAAASPLYFWGKNTAYLFLGAAFLLIFIAFWKKYSYASIIISALTVLVLLFAWPLILMIYYKYGFLNMLLIFLIAFLFYIFYSAALKLYIDKSKNIKILITLGNFLQGELKNEVFAKISEIINNSSKSNNYVIFKDSNKDKNLTCNLNCNDKIKSYLQKKLNSNSSKDKAKFYLKILCQFDQPPFYLIISQLNYYNLKGHFIGKELKMVDREIETRSIITGELLYYLRFDNYKLKQRAAEILSAYKDPLTLIPLKNLIKRRKELVVDKYTLYFTLDILADFAPTILAQYEKDAADFSELLKYIIINENDDWLKYHALKAYLEIGVNDDNYEGFIKKIREREKEPVLLALNNEIQ